MKDGVAVLHLQYIHISIALFLLSVYTVFSYTVYPVGAEPYTVIYTATEAKIGAPPV